MASGAALIKKYGNRRLYDTEDSCYLTLEELVKKVRAGREVRIIDAKTEEDLTQVTLAQLIFEGEAARFLPIPLLTQLLRLGDDGAAEFFSRYVTWALEIYLSAKRGVQTVTTPPTLGTLTQLPAAALEAMQRMWLANPLVAMASAPFATRHARPARAPTAAAPPEDGADAWSSASPSPGAEHDTGPTHEDFAQLRRELADLRNAMRNTEGAPHRSEAPQLGRPGSKRRPRY